MATHGTPNAQAKWSNAFCTVHGERSSRVASPGDADARAVGSLVVKPLIQQVVERVQQLTSAPGAFCRGGSGKRSVLLCCCMSQRRSILFTLNSRATGEKFPMMNFRRSSYIELPAKTATTRNRVIRVQLLWQSLRCLRSIILSTGKPMALELCPTRQELHRDTPYSRVYPDNIG